MLSTTMTSTHLPTTPLAPIIVSRTLPLGKIHFCDTGRPLVNHRITVLPWLSDHLAGRCKNVIHNTHTRVQVYSQSRLMLAIPEQDFLRSAVVWSVSGKPKSFQKPQQLALFAPYELLRV